MVLGEKKLAIENYKKSLQLNPGNANGLKKLKEMGINTDTHVKAAKVSIEYLKQLEGDYLSTNQPNWVRWIKFVEEGGVLVGNDNGYRYKLIPMGGDGKFINPDDGASLIFDTENKNGITLSLFGTINLKKVKTSKESTLSLKEYSGIYIPSKKDTILRPMEVLNSKNKLFRFIENPSDFTPNRNIELEFVTENIFFYPDKSNRSIEFIVNDKKEVTGCFVRRPDGTFQLSKQK